MPWQVNSLTFLLCDLVLFYAFGLSSAPVFCFSQCTDTQMFLLVLVVLVVTGRTPLVRRRVWRSQCRAMTCQRWVGRLGGGGWLRGAGLAGHGNPPDASSPLSCCVGKTEQQHTVNIKTGRTSFMIHFFSDAMLIKDLGMFSVNLWTFTALKERPWPHIPSAVIWKVKLKMWRVH